MVAMNNQSSLERLKKCSRLSKEIGAQCKQLEVHLSNVRPSVMDDLKPYINPKRNIDALCSFYELFSNSKEKIDTSRKRLEGLFGEATDSFPPRELRVLKESSALGEVRCLVRERELLSEYGNIRMARTELEHVEKFIGKALDAIKGSFFVALDKLPEQDPNLQEFAKFLLENTNRKAFLAEYTEKIYAKLGIEDIGTNRRMLLERARNLGTYFNEIGNMNDNVLGLENARALNLGLFKTFVLELKGVIADVLMVVEKEERADDVPFLVQLNAALRHSEHGYNELIGELFELKDNINKIIHNCLLAYFERLSFVSEPDKHSDAEGMCAEMARILDAFYYNKDVGDAFASAYGAAFNVRSVQDILEEFSTRVIRRVLLLSEQKKGISKSVYLVNNAYVLQHYLREIDGVSMGDYLSSNTSSIISVWEKEVAKRKESDVTEFLNQNIRLQQNHFLPVELRGRVTGRIKELVEELLGRKEYKGEKDKLMEAVESLYSAE
jgi:hypothetical protein